MRISKKKLRGLSLSACCLLAMLALSGCSLFGNGAGKAGKAPANQQVYTSPLILLNGSTDLTTLDPALAYDQNSLSAISMLYTGLVQLDDHMQVQPQLASTWNQSSDGLTWTFNLRPNLKFSDGTPLTASDVAYSLNRALTPATKSTVAPIYLGRIQNSDKLLSGGVSTLINDSIKVVNPQTLTITTQKPTPYFLSMLSNACSYVVEQKLITEYGDKFADHLNAGGGAGPFIVKQYIHGQKIVFVPNPHYYGPKPQLREVVFPFYTQQAAAYNAYAAGKVDTAGVPLAALPKIAQRPDYHQVPQLWINYYTMNYNVPPFNNINIRQAFALAINKQAIAKNVWKNTVIPTNHIVPQGMPGYDQGLKCPQNAPTKGDPTKAKQLFQEGMQQEGYTLSSFPSITITYPSGDQPTADQITTMVQAWQSILGITVKTQAVDFTTLLGDVTASACQTPDSPQKCLNKGLQMWWLGWIADYPDPQDWTTLQFAKGVSNNDWNYGQNFSSDAAQQVATQNLLEKADIDLGKDRLSLYNQAEQQLVNDVAWMPLFQSDAAVLVKKYVYGVVLNAQGITPPDDWANIYIAVH